ncbi:MAG: SDR family NAD(P)-dependent oxidoreductase [Bacilli bacterium]
MKRLNQYIDNELANIKGQKIIVTGANSGIGFSICDVLLLKQAHLVMACRDRNRGMEARLALQKRHPLQKIEIIFYDQSSLLSIKNFVDLLTNQHSDFSALILNAGVFRPRESLLFENNVPLTMGTNFLGPLYIVDLLQPFLQQVQSEKRIIFQGSLTYHINKYHSKEKSFLNIKEGLIKQYNISKLGVTQIFNFYSSSCHNPYVKYLLAEPGVSNTQIIRNYNKWFKNIASSFLSIFTHSNVKASLSACWLTTQRVANGSYYRPRGLAAISGYPCHAHFKMKYIDYRMVIDGLEIIESLKGN